MTSALSQHKVGVGIPGGGSIRIGQRLKSIDGDYEPEYSFRGKLAKINMWSRVLNENVIVALFRSPGAEIGDLISWRNIRNAPIHGNISVENVSTIPFTSKIALIERERQYL